MENKTPLDKLNEYRKLNFLHDQSVTAHNALSRFMENCRNNIPFEELKQISDTMQIFSKYVWRDDHIKALQEVEELLISENKSQHGK
jgi:hypothetical protein